MRTEVSAPSLITALNQSELVKDKVEECAHSAVNQALGEQIAAPLDVANAARKILENIARP